MRVLLTADTVGGVWTFACELAGELLRLGHSTLLVAFGGTPTAAQSTQVVELERLGDMRFVVGDASLEWQPSNQHAYTDGAALLVQLCAEFAPDALILSQFCYGSLPVACPKLVVAHSDVLSWAAGVGKAPLPDDEWLRTYRSLVQAGLNGADLVVAPTAAMLTDLKQHFRVDAPSAVIHNGRTLVKHPETETRQLRAVTAGRMWDPAKNLALLLTAELPLPVLVAGTEEGSSVGNANVQALGKLSAEELLTVFRESAIYLCCSVYEPFGLAPLEGALCGCAVVAYDIPTLREVWADGALYFHNAETLTEVLQMLVADPRILEAAQARSHAVAQRYTAATMSQGYLKAIGSLAKQRHKDARAA